jgi:hypothetical protein
MSNTIQIVTVNVTQNIAPRPLQLQRTGALISQGGTNLPAGTSALITQRADLIPLLNNAIAITAMTWASGVVTVTLASPHGLTIGDTEQAIIVGVVPAGYNGVVDVTATSVNQFTYLVAIDYGMVTTFGTFTLEDVRQLGAMVNTYFAQGNANSVYVLELGSGTPAEGVTALRAYIDDPLVQFYSYLLPYEWATEPTAITMARDYSSTTALLYFWVSVKDDEYLDWVGIKSAVMMYYDPTVTPVTEFTCASMFYVSLNYNPSITNKVTPMAFSYVNGVTIPPISKVKQLTLKNSFCNYIGSGAQGGISNKIILWGTTGDGRDFTYWYSVDWVQTNIDVDLSNAIINGSNNPINPLYYDQNGINRLQKVAQGTMNNGISYGLVLGPAPVSAVPFVTYVQNNPSDYPIGKYAGLSVTYTPNRGFIEIIFNVNVTDFVLA